MSSVPADEIPDTDTPIYDAVVLAIAGLDTAADQPAEQHGAHSAGDQSLLDGGIHG
ncbi:MAG TPA: hypothetical protein VFX16_33520 [Pseudonocardiaceae bacterium]|nr:hypothetical protein [Pseudonocardiaceae bacterium]